MITIIIIFRIFVSEIMPPLLNNELIIDALLLMFRFLFLIIVAGNLFPATIIKERKWNINYDMSLIRLSLNIESEFIITK